MLVEDLYWLREEKKGLHTPKILGLGTSLPARRLSQGEIFNDILLPHLGSNPKAEAIFRNAGVGHRHTVVDGSFYVRARSTQERNERYLAEAMPLGEEAIQRCLDQAGLAPQEVDDLFVVSCTGLDVPGLDLRLAAGLGMRPDLRRTCVLGMGCYATFPALLRAREAAGARAGRTALVLAVELCSLHFQPDNPSTENVVISSLFGDGAAAVLIGSQENAIQGEQAGSSWPYLLDSLTHSDYRTMEHMAFHVTNHGFLMRLSPEVPDVLAANIEGFVDGLLAKNGLARDDIRYWCVHPGGVKILDATQSCLGLPDEALSSSRSVLYQYGNMSSATVLFVLEEIQRQRRPQEGDYGVMMAFGPGLTLEGALVQW